MLMKVIFRQVLACWREVGSCKVGSWSCIPFCSLVVTRSYIYVFVAVFRCWPGAPAETTKSGGVYASYIHIVVD